MIASGERAVGEQGWRGLYLVGAATALIAAVFFRRYCSAELIMLNELGVLSADVNMAPIRAQEWFALFQATPLVGLILFDVLDLVNYALIGLIYLALFGALRQQNAAAVTVALAAGLVGIAVHFASNQAFAMFALSRQYAQAATETQQAVFAAAGEALLAMTYPGGPYPGTGIGIALFLVTVAGLIFAVLMRRCPAFGRAAAWIGILAHSLMLLFFVTLAVAPAWSPLPPSLSAVFLLAWYLIIAWRLFQLGTGRFSPSVHETR